MEVVERGKRVQVVLGSSGEGSACAWGVPCEQLPNRRPSPGLCWGGYFYSVEANKGSGNEGKRTTSPMRTKGPVVES